MGLLINLLIWILLFAVLAYGLYWTCTHFFPSFPPALWICGVILLILILVTGNSVLHGGIVLYR